VHGDLTRQNITLHGTIPPDLPPVYGRGDQLMQVFLNLVLNAIDAMHNGGALCVEAAVEPDSRTLSVHIRDTGVGIDTITYQRIFDPFYTTKVHGTGLGLAVCQQIVTDHEGTIDVQSTPGQGSSFTVRLPLFIPL
jgi:two-component system NtrC family sensor kinase